ncbi:MAG: hypothetical protein V5A62_19130 [Haloarculaceae archaeon]
MTGTDVGEAAVERSGAVVPWTVVLLVGGSVALVATVGQWGVAAGVGLWLRPTGFAVVAAGILAGRPARWGSAVGLLVAGTLLGAFSSSVAWALAAFAAAAVSARLWARDDEGREGGSRSWLVRYVVVAVGGVVVFAATSAWLLDALGRAAFSVTAARTVSTNLPVALAGAPVVRLGLERAGEHDWRVHGRPLTASTRAAVILIALLWTVGGELGSFLFRVVQRVPPASLARRFPPAVVEFVTLWGWQGTYAQFSLGAVALAAIGLLLRRRSPHRTDDDRTRS